MILTPDKLKKYILSTLSQEDIFCHYLNIDEKDINYCLENNAHKIPNPLRTDYNPSMGFMYNNKNKLLLRDWGNSYYNGDCFHIVGIIINENCNDSRGFVNICKDIINNLINKDAVEFNRISKPVIRTVKHLKTRSVIKITKRKWNNNDKDYWKPIDIEFLKLQNIHPVEFAWVNSDYPIYAYNIEDPCYAYYEGDDEGIKIYKLYFPLRLKKYKQPRFLTNNVLPFEQLSEFGKDYNVFITKSSKDAITLRYIKSFSSYWGQTTYSCISLLHEGVRLTSKQADAVCNRHKGYRFINTDFDVVGISTAIYHHLGYGFLPIHIGTNTTINLFNSTDIQNLINVLKKDFDIDYTESELKDYINKHRNPNNKCKDIFEYTKLNGVSETNKLINHLIAQYL